jgi:replication factor A1
MIEDERIAPHVDDIARVLKDRIDKEEIEKELRIYITEYRIPLSTAKQMLVKRYGGSPGDLGLGVSKTIDKLQGNEPSVDMMGRLIAVNYKEIDVGGEKKKIAYGIIGDQTASTSFTAWDVSQWSFQKGDVISVHNAYTKEWKGQPQINFGDRTRIELESKDVMPDFVATPLSNPKNLSVSELKKGTGNVSITARVLSMEKRTVTVEGMEKQVISGLVADSTGKIQFSSWHDFGFGEGDVIRVKGGYVKSWRGIPQFNFDERAEVAVLEADELPPISELAKRQVVEINDLVGRGGAVDISVDGVILDIRSGSGLIFRCPECRRVLQKGICRIHGEVEGMADLRIKAVLDDGTGALTAIMGRELTESLLGKDLAECTRQAQEALDQGVIRDELRSLLVAIPIRLSGDATIDDFGVMMITKETKMMDVEVQDKARIMLEQLEGDR